MATLGRSQRLAALVPLAVLSLAWTAAVATSGSDAAPDGTTLPDGSRVPTEAVKPPASLTAPSGLTPGIHGDAHRIVSTASASGIPAVALAAYQRAATSSTPPTPRAICRGSWWRPSGGWSPTTAAPTGAC
jgi:hypothetical protein